MNEQEKLNILARSACREGQGPATMWGITGKSETQEESSSIYNDLYDEYSRLELPKQTTDIFDQTCIYLNAKVNEMVEALHLRALIDKEFYFLEVKKNNKYLAAGINRTDDWGLISIDKMKGQLGWFEWNNFALYLAPSVPGKLNASFQLLPCLTRYAGLGGVSFRPDPFRIIPTSSASHYVERAAVFGRPFNSNWLKSLKGTEEAQHDPTIFSDGHTTQFIWERISPNEIQFAIEELPNFYDQEGINELSVARFIHGIFDSNTERFIHLDGAIHIYKEESYKVRVKKQLKDHYKDYSKAKIFRIDRHISVNEATNLCLTFFRWNYQVPEYLTP